MERHDHGKAARQSGQLLRTAGVRPFSFLGAAHAIWSRRGDDRESVNIAERSGAVSASQ